MNISDDPPPLSGSPACRIRQTFRPTLTHRKATKRGKGKAATSSVDPPPPPPSSSPISNFAGGGGGGGGPSS